DNGSLTIQYNRNRYYDYYTGRWTIHDPLGIDPAGGEDNAFSLSLQYVSGLNLWEYVNNNPVHAADTFGLWGSDVHLSDTQNWAKEAQLCYGSDVASWCNSVDSGLGNPPLAYKISVAVSILSFISKDPLLMLGGPVATAKYLKWIAYWHWPGADLGMPVDPGGWAALREVNKGIVRCNLEVFSKGLHQLQDSYSHQTNGELPPFGGNKVGHSRDRYGWNTEQWNNPAVNPVPRWLQFLLKSKWMPGFIRDAAKKKLRKIRVALSYDADDPDLPLVNPSYKDTKTATVKYMKWFRDECPCIEEGPHKGKCSRCQYRESSLSIVP
ncbi:MAG: hypothetical protein ACYTBJ_24325, partial [Planctomycetota bacterium]